MRVSRKDMRDTVSIMKQLVPFCSGLPDSMAVGS